MCIMKALGTIVAGLGLLVFVAPAPAADKDKDKDDSKKLLVGKWETKQKFRDMEIKIQAEFTKDGELIFSFGQNKIKGKYSVVDEKTIETEMTVQGKTMKEKVGYKVTKDTLELMVKR